jgi:adenine-specific DNA-methyltransferase
MKKVIGCDKEPRYVEIAQERIEAFYRGELAIRPIDRDLYTPVGKVSRVPDEWRLISNSIEEV